MKGMRSQTAKTSEVAGAPDQYPSLFMSTRRRTHPARSSTKRSMRAALSRVCAKLLRNSSSLGRLSLHAMGVCTYGGWQREKGVPSMPFVVFPSLQQTAQASYWLVHHAVQKRVHRVQLVSGSSAGVRVWLI